MVAIGLSGLSKLTVAIEKQLEYLFFGCKKHALRMMLLIALSMPMAFSYAVELPNNITADTVLTSGQNYSSVGNVLVAADVTLTIEAGVVIEFGAGDRLIVDGELELQGTAANPVVFTTQSSSPQTRDWRGVTLNNTAVPHTWSHLVVEYANDIGIYVEDGVTLNLLDSELRFNITGIRFDPQSQGKVENSRIADNTSSGLEARNSSPLIRNNLFEHANGLISARAIYIAGAPNQSLIEGNTIDAYRYGLWVDGLSSANVDEVAPIVTGNNLINNTNAYYALRYPIDPASITLNAQGNWWGTTEIEAISASIFDHKDSSGSPQVDYRGFLDGPVPTGQPVALATVPIYIDQDTTLAAGETYSTLSDITIAEGAKLTIEAGVVVRFARDDDLTVNGELELLGTADNPVVFTTQSSDPQTRDWRGITLNNTTVPHNWSHLVVEYANGPGIYVEDGVTLNLSDSELRFNITGISFDPQSQGRVEGSRIADNTSIGIQARNSSPLIRNNQFEHANGLVSARAINILGGPNQSLIEGNTIDAYRFGLWVDGLSSVNADEVAPVVTGNNLINNTNAYYALRYPIDPASITLDAQGNWWGTSNSSEIEQSIYDYNDNPSSSPNVDFNGFTSQPIVIDRIKPPSVRNVSVQAGLNQATLSWQLPEANVEDIATYRITLVGQPPIEVDAPLQSFVLTNLAAASFYTVEVVTIDAAGNQSDGINAYFSTQFPNPAGLSAIERSNVLDLSWAIPTEFAGISRYRIYASQTPFTNVNGMTTALEVNNNVSAANIGGLENGVAYHLAITSVSQTGLETQEVTTIIATPQEDTTAPSITSLMYGQTVVASNLTVANDDQFCVQLDDISPISRVEFVVDQLPAVIDSNGSDGYCFAIRLDDYADGAHTLTVSAYDVHENVAPIDAPFSIQLAAPPAPSLSSPSNGFVTNQSLIQVAGNTLPGLDVQVSVNDEAGDWVRVNATGSFIVDAYLAQEGDNSLTVKARNRAGESVASPAVIVTLDTSLPAKPIGVNAQAKAGGVVTLSWANGTGGRVVSYDVYRSESDSFDIPNSGKVNTSPIIATAFSDLVVNDGTYFYKVVSLNSLDVVSEPSASAEVIVDVTDPVAHSIEYSTDGHYDATTQTYGRGILSLQLTVSEPLLTTPFLSISPDGGVPISVALSPLAGSQTMYEGQVLLDETVRSGIAYAVFSARDKVGNRGTQVESGEQIRIDTAGPRISQLTVTPNNPIKNEAAAPTNIQVQFEVDEPLSTTTPPVLNYTLSSTATEQVPANNMVKVADQVWQATVQLDSNAGADEAETLQFYFTGFDQLQNSGTSIEGINAVQVYQGDLPPLAAPFNFRGTALPSGRIELQWFEVGNASAYKLYRRGPNEQGFSEYQELSSGNAYIDQTDIDGTYEYQLSTIRSENGELAESARTEIVSVVADSIAPATPQNLSLQLTSIGIQAEWSAVSGDGIRYALFTDATGPISSTDTLEPVLSNLTQPFVVDSNATQAKPAYAVVAVDEVGNQSAPSETAYLNVDLLPVSSISVRLEQGQLPVLSWQHSRATINNFDVYFGEQGNEVKLNQAAINDTQYTDIGYANANRTYSVVAIDANDARSLPRFIRLPKVTLNVADEQVIKRNLMNSVNITVINDSDQAIANARVKLIDGIGHFQSARVSIPANSELIVPVTIGGIAILPDLWTPSLELHSEPNAGETVQVARPVELTVRDSALSVGLETSGFIRGAVGTVVVSIENTGDEAIQIITASNQGNADSPDIQLSLHDDDDNVLSVTGVRQVLGEGLLNNAAGETLVTIAAGERWSSEPMSLTVPDNAPDTVNLSLQVRQIYANRGSAEEVMISGPRTRQSIVLADTPYRGVITAITPAQSFGEQPIIITGQALERETDRALGNVDLTLVVTSNGFEREFELSTEADGSFSFAYQTQGDESGQYTVSVLHPIQTSRPNNGEFVIRRLTVSPSQLNLRIPYGLDYDIPLTFEAGEGTQLSNLRFEVLAEKQPNGLLPQGIAFAYPSINEISSAQRVTANITVTADDTAEPSGQFIVSVFSDESPNVEIATIDVLYTFSEAEPAFAFKPAILELGSTLNTNSMGVITLENRGLAPLKNVRLSLKTVDGFPAFDWIKLATHEFVGDIEVGQIVLADILLQPGNTAPLGIEHFVLEVSSANAPTYAVPIITSVVESGQGGVLVKVTDMYSGTLNSIGQVIQGLNNANVRIQNESDPSITFNVVADELGEVFVEDIPAGRYSVWASAPNYREVHQRIRVQPGLIASEQIFLDYELIRLEWTVNEITLQDRYEITLRATFETDVPAAVVMIEPTSIKLPDMQPGDVYYGELSMTNYGLIRAYNIDFQPQLSDEFYQFEYLTNVVPEALEAKEQVLVPYKITALRSLEQQDATGGGCGVYTKCSSVSAESQCPTGVSETATSSCVTVSYGSCGGVGEPRAPERPTFDDGSSDPTFNEGAGAGGGFGNDPLPPGSGLPMCRPYCADCEERQRGGGQ